MALDFNVTLNDQQFQQKLRSVEQSSQRTASSMSKTMTGSGNAMSGAFGKLGGAVAGAFAVGKVMEFGSAVLGLAGDITDLSESLNINAEKLQMMQGAFAEGGVDSEKFAKALTKLTDNISSAEEGAGPARDAFDKLGISFNEFAGKSSDQVLMRIADALRDSKDKTVAFAAATDLLGKGSFKMIGAMSQGSDAIRKTGVSYQIMSDDAREALDAAGDSIEKWKNNTKVAAANIAGTLLGLFDKDKWTFEGMIGASPKKPKESKTRVADKKVDPLEEKRMQDGGKALQDLADVQIDAAKAIATDEERILIIQGERQSIAERIADAQGLEAIALQKKLTLKDAELAKEKKILDEKNKAKREEGIEKAAKEIEIMKGWDEYKARLEQDKKRTGEAFRDKVSGGGMGVGDAWKDGGLFSTGGTNGKMGVLSSKAYGQTPITSRAEREAVERDRVAQGLGRSASTMGAYGAVRRGDREIKKQEERRQMQKKLTVEGTNELLEKILKMQDDLWNKK